MKRFGNQAGVLMRNGSAVPLRQAEQVNLLGWQAAGTAVRANGRIEAAAQPQHHAASAPPLHFTGDQPVDPVHFRLGIQAEYIHQVILMIHIGEPYIDPIIERS